MNSEINIIKLEKTFKELHETNNDVCPICDKPFVKVIGGMLIKYKNKAYHYECWEELKG